MPDESVLIPLETPAGDAAPIPQALAFDAPADRPKPSSTADAGPEPVAAAPPTTPTPEPEKPATPVVPAQPVDPEKAGILRELSETRAERAQARQEVARLTGMVEALSKQVAPAPVVTGPLGPSPAELEEKARTLGLYKADGSGQLDLALAARVIKAEEQRATDAAKRVVEERVKPLEEYATTQQGQKGITDLYAVARQMGVDDQFTQMAIDKLTGGDLKLLSTMGVQANVALAAGGLQKLAESQGKFQPARKPVAPAPGAPAPPVVAPAAPSPFVADSGQRPPATTTQELSTLEKKALRGHHIKPEEHRAFTSVLDKANETGRIPSGGWALEE